MVCAWLDICGVAIYLYDFLGARRPDIWHTACVDRTRMSQVGRLFVREVNVVIIVMIAATILGSALHYVSVVHEMQQVRQELCAVKLELVTVRNPYLRDVADARDKCAMLVALTSDALSTRLESGARIRQVARFR